MYLCKNRACSILRIHVNISMCVNKRTHLLQYVAQFKKWSQVTQKYTFIKVKSNKLSIHLVTEIYRINRVQYRYVVNQQLFIAFDLFAMYYTLYGLRLDSVTEQIWQKNHKKFWPQRPFCLDIYGNLYFCLFVTVITMIHGFTNTPRQHLSWTRYELTWVIKI